MEVDDKSEKTLKNAFQYFRFSKFSLVLGLDIVINIFIMFVIEV